MSFYAGIDWSENLQDWAVLDSAGRKLRHGKFALTPEGIASLLAGLEEFRDPLTGELPPVAIETSRGVLVAALVAAGLTVHPVNPLKAKRYAEITNVSGKKNDKADAFMLATALRLNIDAHPPMPSYSVQGMSLTQLGRAHQDALWRTLRLTNELRSLLQEFWPAVNGVFKPSQLLKPEVLAVLMEWPAPDSTRTMTKKHLRQVLVDAGRSRYLDRDVDAWHAALRVPVLENPAGLQDAYGERLRALAEMLDTCARVERRMRDQVLVALAGHPLNELVAGVPGLGGVTAARLIGELGDDPNRFAAIKNVRAFSGTAPIHKSSSTSSKDVRRHVKNNRVNHSAFLWAFNALTASKGARAAYDNRRSGMSIGNQPHPLKDKHAAALRNVGYHLIGGFWHCVTTGDAWNENEIWGRFLPDKPDGPAGEEAASPEPAPRGGPSERVEDTDEPEFERLFAAEQAVSVFVD